MRGLRSGVMWVCTLLLYLVGPSLQQMNEQFAMDTRLWFAALNGDQKVVNMSITAGANVNIVLGGSATFVQATCFEFDELCGTPLLIAAMHGHEDAIPLLVNAGAEIDYQNDRGETPLTVAAKNGHTAVVSILVEEGADPNLSDSEGNTALFYSSEQGIVDVVQLLLEMGADPDLANNNGDTPLHAAARGGFLMIVEELLRMGANSDIRNTVGELPKDQICANASDANQCDAVDLSNLLAMGSSQGMKDDFEAGSPNRIPEGTDDGSAWDADGNAGDIIENDDDMIEDDDAGDGSKDMAKEDDGDMMKDKSEEENAGRDAPPENNTEDTTVGNPQEDSPVAFSAEEDVVCPEVCIQRCMELHIDCTTLPTLKERISCALFLTDG